MKFNPVALTACIAVAGAGSMILNALPHKALSDAATVSILANPSFETASDIGDAVSEGSEGLRGYAVNDISGWKLEDSNISDLKRLYVTTGCATDNGFGTVTTIADGDYALYLRRGWNTGTPTLSQTIAGLPSG
ncbi:MAG: hypothetical protein K2J38_02170, partial [Muribaculaceae bacterium]|nr:hypothetical protein [Muribaculaceae bacterium]